MTRWRTFVYVLMAAALLVSIPGFSQMAAASQQQQGILLLYDSEAKSTPREGNIEALVRLIISFGKAVTVQSTEDYRMGEMSAYSRVLFVRNAPDLPQGNAEFTNDLAAYKGSYLQIGGSDVPRYVQDRLSLRIRQSPPETFQLSAGGYSQLLTNMLETLEASGAGVQAYGKLDSESSGASLPYAVSDGTVAYASDLENGTLTEIALGGLLKDWLQAQGDPNTYVLIKEIYPFSDLNLLKIMSDKLYDAGIPFLIAVKPVFYNTDYPAMKRYLQALAYAQSHNGTIIVDSPAVSVTSTEDDPSLSGKMSGFLNLLADNGIGPLAMNVPMFLAFDKIYSTEGMKYFDSVILEPNDPTLRSTTLSLSTSFLSAPFVIPFDQFEQYRPEGGPVRSPMPMETVLTLDLFKDEAALDEAVAALSDSWIPFADYKTSSHTVRTDNREVRSDGGILLVNGESVDMNKASAEVNGDYAYTQKAYVSFKKLFSVQNRIMVVVILFVLGLFCLFLFIGYRRYKRKFYHSGGRNDAL